MRSAGAPSWFRPCRHALTCTQPMPPDLHQHSCARPLSTYQCKTSLLSFFLGLISKAPAMRPLGGNGTFSLRKQGAMVEATVILGGQRALSCEQVWGFRAFPCPGQMHPSGVLSRVLPTLLSSLKESLALEWRR